MARDIFMIPVTTVASESTFSAGGRVLSDYRSSLSPKTLDALVCAGSWIRSTYKASKDPLVYFILFNSLSQTSYYFFTFFSKYKSFLQFDILSEENLIVKLPAEITKTESVI